VTRKSRERRKSDDEKRTNCAFHRTLLVSFCRHTSGDLNAFFATEKTVTFPNITDILALSIKQCPPLVAANVNEIRPLPKWWVSGL
jgi:hypothetical protein